MLVVPNTPAAGDGGGTTHKDWRHIEADFVYERSIESLAYDAPSSFDENSGYLSGSQFAQSRPQAHPFHDEGSIPILIGEDFGGGRESPGSGSKPRAMAESSAKALGRSVADHPRG